MSVHQFNILRWVTSNILNTVLIAVCLLSGWAYVNESKQRAEEARLFHEATKAGRWFWDLRAEARGLPSLSWDHTMFEIFGQPKTGWSPNYGGFENCIYTPDKAFVKERVQKAIQSRSGYSAVFRIIDQRGGISHILAAAYVSTSGDYMTGICVPLTGDIYSDITTRVFLPPL